MREDRRQRTVAVQGRVLDGALRVQHHQPSGSAVALRPEEAPESLDELAPAPAGSNDDGQIGLGDVDPLVQYARRGEQSSDTIAERVHPVAAFVPLQAGV